VNNPLPFQFCPSVDFANLEISEQRGVQQSNGTDNQLSRKEMAEVERKIEAAKTEIRSLGISS